MSIFVAMIQTGLHQLETASSHMLRSSGRRENAVTFIHAHRRLLGSVASAQPPQAEFDAAAGRFIGCLTATVRMGMTVKMDPDTFKAGLDKSCKPEETAFRAAAIRQAIALGRTEAEAVAEVEGNIARGRAAFAADQASYVRTGKVPK